VSATNPLNEWINEFNLPWGKAHLKAQSESLFLERFSKVAPVLQHS
jgi:hypothetical protein